MNASGTDAFAWWLVHFDDASTMQAQAVVGP